MFLCNAARLRLRERIVLTVHHLQASQSDRIVWLCEELGVPYDLKIYRRESNGAAPPAYKALHPQGTAPTITDDSVTLAETGAIVDYILARCGGGNIVVAPQAPNFAEYLYWLHFGNGFFVPAAMMLIAARTVAGENKQAAQRFSGRYELAYRLSEKRLGNSPYFAGSEFTVADIMMVYPLASMSILSRSLDDLPNVRAYLERIGKRPAYQRAVQKGNPA